VSRRRPSPAGTHERGVGVVIGRGRDDERPPPSPPPAPPRRPAPGARRRERARRARARSRGPSRRPCSGTEEQEVALQGDLKSEVGGRPVHAAHDGPCLPLVDETGELGDPAFHGLSDHAGTRRTACPGTRQPRSRARAPGRRLSRTRRSRDGRGLRDRTSPAPPRHVWLGLLPARPRKSRGRSGGFLKGSTSADPWKAPGRPSGRPSAAPRARGPSLHLFRRRSVGTGPRRGGRRGRLGFPVERSRGGCTLGAPAGLPRLVGPVPVRERGERRLPHVVEAREKTMSPVTPGQGCGRWAMTSRILARFRPATWMAQSIRFIRRRRARA